MVIASGRGAMLVAPKFHDFEVSSLHVAVEVMVAAFKDYPVFQYICGGPATEEFLQWMFQRYIPTLLQVPGSRVLCDRQADDLRCLSLLLPPNPGPTGAELKYPDISLWLLLRHGIWQLSFKFGVRHLRRTVEVLMGIDEAENEITRQLGTFLFQDYLCANLRWQSLGLGGVILEASIATLQHGKNVGIPVILKTYSERACNSTASTGSSRSEATVCLREVPPFTGSCGRGATRSSLRSSHLLGATCDRVRTSNFCVGCMWVVKKYSVG